MIWVGGKASGAPLWIADGINYIQRRRHTVCRHSKAPTTTQLLCHPAATSREVAGQMSRMREWNSLVESLR